MNKMEKALIAMVLGIFSVFFSSSIIAAPSLLNIQIPLGAVNGAIINNNTVRISKTLTQSSLINVTRSDNADYFNLLRIKNAKIVKKYASEIQVEINQMLPGGEDAVIYATVGIWINGEHRSLNTVEQGNGVVNITLRSDLKRIELRVVGPLIIDLPKNFKGMFNFNIDIDAVEN